MNDKLEAIREACIKANPEIVELKFGCEVKDTFGKAATVLFQPDNNPDNIYCLSHHTTFSHAKSILKEILGRPIRLADVLLAVASQTEQIKLDLWAEEVGIGNDERGRCLWNLRTDDLTKQSQECIDFLYELPSPQGQ